jgi:hypothetical protein
VLNKLYIEVGIPKLKGGSVSHMHSKSVSTPWCCVNTAGQPGLFRVTAWPAARGCGPAASAIGHVARACPLRSVISLLGRFARREADGSADPGPAAGRRFGWFAGGAGVPGRERERALITTQSTAFARGQVKQA